MDEASADTGQRSRTPASGDTNRASCHMVDAQPQDLAETITLLSSADVRTRRRAIEALARESDPRALPALAAAIGDEDVDVQLGAVRAVGSISDPRVPEMLREVVSRTDLDDFVRRDAVLALRDLRETTVLRCVLADEAQGWIVRSEAALALARLRDVGSLALIVNALRNGHERLREPAANALCELGDARAIDALRYAATNDENRNVRKAARNAVRRLSGCA